MLCNLTYIHVNTRSLKRLKCKLVNLLVIVFSGFFLGGGDKTKKKDIKKNQLEFNIKMSSICSVKLQASICVTVL